MKNLLNYNKIKSSCAKILNDVGLIASRSEVSQKDIFWKTVNQVFVKCFIAVLVFSNAFLGISFDFVLGKITGKDVAPNIPTALAAPITVNVVENMYGSGGTTYTDYEFNDEYPIITGMSSNLNLSNGTSHVIQMPPNIKPGELLVVVFSVDGNPTVTTTDPTWNKLGQGSYSSVVTGTVFWKVAESASESLTLTTTASEMGTHISYRIGRHNGVVQGGFTSSTGTNSNPPSFSPSGGSGKYMWLATRSGDSTGIATAVPSGYSFWRKLAGYNTSSASTDVAVKFSTAASEDPGVWTSPSAGWVSWTLAIPAGNRGHSPEVTTGDAEKLTNKSAAIKGDTGEWKPRTAAEANQWNSVTYGNGLFVAVAGSGTNRVMTSPDGITWTPRTAAATNPWSSVTYGNGMFVAVASAGTTSRVMTSPDGITWTARTVPESNNWNSVTYGNSLFVAVASTGTNRVMTSPDGITWTARAAAQANTWNSVTYGNGTFVAVAPAGTNRVMTSTNGTTWTVRTAAEANQWRSVTYGNGLFVAVAWSGTNRVMTSPDGTTWTARAAAAGNAWNSVIYGNGRFVAVAQNGTNRVMTSTNGTTWTSQPAAGDSTSTWLSVTYSNGLFVSVASGGTNRVMTADFTSPITDHGFIYGTKSDLIGGNTATSSLNGVLAAGAINLNLENLEPATTYYYRTYATNGYGTGYGEIKSFTTYGPPASETLDASDVTDSTATINGEIENYALDSWTGQTIPGSYSLSKITYGNGKFVAVDWGTALTSSDGINWTASSLYDAAPFEIPSWNSITYGNGLFVLVGYSGDVGVKAEVMTSPDGITWTPQNAPYGVILQSVTYGNGKFVAVSGYNQEVGSPDIYTSTNGTTWTSSVSNTNISAADRRWTVLTYGNGLFVAIGGDGGSSDRVITSPDGITWTVRTAATVDAWSSVTYGNGLFVAVSRTGVNRVMTSPDGITWTSRTAAEAINWQSVTYGNGLFVAVSSDGINRVMTSPDGITWTALPAALNDWTSVTYGNGLFAAVSSSGTNRVMTASLASDHGFIWGTSPSLSGGDTATTSLGSINGIGNISTNLENLQPGTAYYYRAYATTAYGTGYGEIKALYTAGFPFAETNAASNITTNSATINGKVLSASAPLSGVGDLGNFVARSIPTNDSWQSITYGNGIFMALGENGLIATSSDGINWRASIMDEFYIFWKSIAYGNGRFVGVGYYGNYVSTDNGATWQQEMMRYAHTITYGNGKFVAYRSDGEMGISPSTAVSSDGIDWVYSENIGTAINSMTYGNGLFVAVGSNVVKTSPDGLTWTTRTAAEANTWLSVTYGNGLFVAVAGSGTNRVMTSPDGITWTARAAAEANVWQSVTYGNGLFVAVARSGIGNRVMVSSDGITWTARAAAAANTWWAVTYGNGKFVAVSTGGTNRVMSAELAPATTDHGFIWGTSPSLSGGDTATISLGNVGNSGSLFSANLTDLATSTAYYYRSYITTNYGTGYGDIEVLYTAGPPMVETTEATDVGAFSATLNGDVLAYTEPSPVFGAWTARSTANISGTYKSWTSVTYGNGLFVAVGDLNNTIRVMTSPDGITWTPRGSVFSSWNSVTYGNGMFVAVGGSDFGPGIMSSPDGITWTGSGFSGEWYNSVTYGNGMFVAVGDSGVKTSPDGITWTDRTAAEANGWWAVTYGNGLFVAVSNIGTNRVMTSPDGITWTARSASSAISWRSVAYGNGLFVAVSCASTGYCNGTTSNKVMTSPDGITWTERTALSNNWTSITYGNGMFLAVAQNTGNTMMSSNGVEWTNKAGTGSDWWGVTYGNGKFVAVASNSSSNNVMTADYMSAPTDHGFIWGTESDLIGGDTATTSLGSISATGVASTTISGLEPGEEYYYRIYATAGFGTTYGEIESFTTIIPVPVVETDDASDITGNSATLNGEIVSYDLPPPELGEWTARTAAEANYWTSITYGNGLFVAVANNGTNRVMTSPDGITWTPRTAASANTWRSVTYGNGMFVAVSNAVMTSPDGITWTSRTVAEENPWLSVTYGNGLFVAVANNGTNRVMTSPDGITWTARAATEANIWTSVTYGNGLFVAVSNSGTNRVMTSPDGITWTARTAAEANSWQSVTYGNGLFVAVAGSGTNRVMTSPDGITWTARAAAEANSWIFVTYANGLFVAVAWSGTNRVMTSPDGITWTARTAAEANTWISVTYGNGLFVALAGDGINRVMTAELTLAPTDHGFIYGTESDLIGGDTETISLGSFAAVGNISGAISDLELGTTYYYRAYATTGYGTGYGEIKSFVTKGVPVVRTDDTTNITANSATLNGEIVSYDLALSGTDDLGQFVARTAATVNAWTSVTYGNGLFVAVGNGSVMTSPDGITWTPRTAATASSWNSVTYGNGLFVAVASFGTNQVMTSPDGITWTARTATEANQWTSVTYGNGMFVAVAQSGTNRVMTSPDGITWTPRTAAAANAWWTVTYGNGLFVAVGYSCTSCVMTSPDGITWTARTISSAWTSITYGNGLFVAVSQSGTVMTSGDGITWIPRTAPEANQWYSVTYGNGLFVAVAYSGTNRVMISTDGITWTARTASEANQWTSVTYANNRFVAVSDNGTNRVMTAELSSPTDHGFIYGTESDLIGGDTATSSAGAFTSAGAISSNIEGLTSGVTYYYRAYATTGYGTGYGEIKSFSTLGLQVVTRPETGVTNNRARIHGEVLLQGTVGTGNLGNWTPRTAAEENSWNSVTYGNGMFVAVAGSGTNRVMTSSDGITWTPRTAAEANTWNSITYGNGRFVAVASNGTNRVMTSPDGITWTPRTAAEASQWYSVTYGNSQFVAVSNNNSNRVMTSPDGITWTARTAAEANSWQSVTYGNGMFVAVALNGTNRVMTSPDGITWTPRTVVTYGWRSVTYGNGLFVALGKPGGLGGCTTNCVMTSPDGITWTVRTAVEVIPWHSITYGNGLFVAVAGGLVGLGGGCTTNCVMTSSDGITWTARTAAEENFWQSVTYGNGMFVAVGYSGTNRVMIAALELTPLAIIDHGFIWGTEESLIGGDTATTSLGALASAGSFDYLLNNLNPNDIYYYRAYAVDANGLRWGEIRSFQVRFYYGGGGAEIGDPPPDGDGDVGGGDGGGGGEIGGGEGQPETPPPVGGGGGGGGGEL